MKKKIKILHIQETIASGGVERLRLSLAKLLDKAAFEQKIICTNAVGHIVDEIQKEGVEIISIGIFKSPFHWEQHKKVQKVISDFQPDIIHGAVFEGVTMAAINGFIKKVPVIILEETSDPQNRSWKGNVLMKLFSQVANKVIGVSEGVTVEYLKGKLHLSDKKAIIINNGVVLPKVIDLNEIENCKTKWGIASGDFVIGSAGRMLQDEHKRFSDLIKAFAVFAKDKTNVKLLLLGDGLEQEGYMKLAKELNIEAKVIFTGYQSDVTSFYSMMSVFSLVSGREAFGLVLAEAMLNKLPVIATKVGGMKYIVDDQQTGFLVEKYDVEAIAEKMETLFQNPLKTKQMGEKGYEKAMKEYTEEVYVGKIAALYESVLSAKS